MIVGRRVRVKDGKFGPLAVPAGNFCGQMASLGICLPLREIGIRFVPA